VTLNDLERHNGSDVTKVVKIRFRQMWMEAFILSIGT